MRTAIIIIVVIALLIAGGIVALDIMPIAPRAQKVEQLVPDSTIPR